MAVTDAAMLGRCSEDQVRDDLADRWPVTFNGSALGHNFGSCLISGSLAGIVPRNINWMWPGKFAYGKLSLLAGMPDTLKSTITLDIMARVTRGSMWPYTSVKADIKNVLLLTTKMTLMTRLRHDY
jgi:hypothetical protein